MFDKILSILDWVKDKLPIQSRGERWRNELDNLKKEKAELLKGQANEKKANRVAVITERIAYLEQLLRNSNTVK